MWDPTKLRPVASDTFWLSETPDVYSGSWETDCIRSAAWIRFRVVGTDAVIVHLNTHLDHISEQARVEGARLIIDRLTDAAADGSAAIVTGDFNAPVGSSAYERFRAAGFADAHVQCGNDDTPGRAFTYHGYAGEAFRGSDSPPRRIDWILLRGGSKTWMRADRCEIARDAQPPAYPSDHYPVIADVVCAWIPVAAGTMTGPPVSGCLSTRTATPYTRAIVPSRSTSSGGPSAMMRPSCIIAMRAAYAAASVRSCTTAMIASPRSMRSSFKS
jgi:hypothetical protein